MRPPSMLAGVLRRLTLLLLALVTMVSLVLNAAPLGSTAAAHPTAATRLFALKPCTPVYAKMDVHSTLLTQLLPGTDVLSIGDSTVGTVHWNHVAFWSGIEGYIPSTYVSTQFPVGVGDNGCSYPGLPTAESKPLPSQHGPFSLRGDATVLVPATVYKSPSARSMPLATLAANTPISFTAWSTDSTGNPWYQVASAQSTGWIWGGNLRMKMPDPATQTVNGKPIWDKMAGKGMYGTNYLVHHSDVNALVQAAKKAGITHIYAEVAITRHGFYAQNSLDRVLPAAHKAGIAVIAWIYTNLDNVGDDARMTQMVANYRTPSGDRADGMLMDIEEVTDSASVYMYGQLARAMLGPNELFVASVFHPYARPGYPYAAIAASFNVIAPMDYWHSRRSHTYSDDDVQRFVGVCIETVRAAMGADGSTPLPVEETGQTYDMYSPASTGWQHAPTANEITADMNTAKNLGAIGVAMYEWQTTTQSEWAAFGAYKW